MKKLIALMLCGAMVLGSSAITFAEAEEAAETEVAEDITVLSYDENLDPEVYDGTWVTCFGVFDLYLPSDWNILVNADPAEEVENNVYFSAESEDQTQAVSISYAPSEYTDIEQVAAAYAEMEGFSEVELVILNDIPCVSYEYETEEVFTTGVVALGDQGGLYNVTVGTEAAGKEEAYPVFVNILVSFSATATEEAE